MKSIAYSIAQEVFDQFPEYVRGVVLAVGVNNQESPDELKQLLRAEEQSLRQRLNIDALVEHECIAAWREAYRQLGIKPSEYRSSIEAMARRVLRGGELPSINALVDIGNVLSLRHLMPAGGHALDQVQTDICLRPANGQEEFIPFGSEEKEHPDLGEFIFAEGDIVLTRRWSWRQANHSLTLLDTRVIEFNLDGLPPIGKNDIEKAAEEMMDLVKKFCGGETSWQMINRQQPSIRLAWD